MGLITNWGLDYRTIRISIVLFLTYQVVKEGITSIDCIKRGIGSLKYRQFVFAGDSPRSTLIKHPQIARARHTRKINVVRCDANYSKASKFQITSLSSRIQRNVATEKSIITKDCFFSESSYF